MPPARNHTSKTNRLQMLCSATRVWHRMIKFRDYAETYAGRSQLGELKGCWNGMLFCLRIFFGKKYTEQNIGLLTYTCYDKYLHIIIFIKIYMLIN